MAASSISLWRNFHLLGVFHASHSGGVVVDKYADALAVAIQFFDAQKEIHGQTSIHKRHQISPLNASETSELPQNYSVSPLTILKHAVNIQMSSDNRSHQKSEQISPEISKEKIPNFQNYSEHEI
ncbi:endoglucanase 2-like [Dorcoceras hygrometricum]|uniref:Endoglucanase 2-like n=1 Tax=Dorcoceras hygrometricum TaxID=472368 RepID=A0A2Z7B4J5_9LAMI|nr:endoglucanase 2-like [Dorcoceras hygrometricum]